MITDLDVIRACRDAQACMTPPSSVEAIMRRYGVSYREAIDAMKLAYGHGLIAGAPEVAWPTGAGLLRLREAE